jgi:hypothetical protein
MVVGKSEGVVVGLIPSGAEPEDQPAVADLVDRRGLLRQHRRSVEARGGHEWTDLHALGDGGEGGEHRPRLPRAARGFAVVAVQQVVPDPDRIETDALRELGHLALFRPSNGALDFGKLDADLQRSRHSPIVPAFQLPENRRTVIGCRRRIL